MGTLNARIIVMSVSMTPHMLKNLNWLKNDFGDSKCEKYISWEIIIRADKILFSWTNFVFPMEVWQSI
jgi:hypothetical protein